MKKSRDSILFSNRWLHNHPYYVEFFCFPMITLKFSFDEESGMRHAALTSLLGPEVDGGTGQSLVVTVDGDNASWHGCRWPQVVDMSSTSNTSCSHGGTRWRSSQTFLVLLVDNHVLFECRRSFQRLPELDLTFSNVVHLTEQKGKKTGRRHLRWNISGKTWTACCYVNY